MATSVARIEESEAQSPTGVSIAPTRRAVWIGRVLSGLAILFLAFDSMVKLLALTPALEGTARLGFPLSSVRPIGVIEVLCLIAYVFPPTAVFGAVLLTGYLGGAIATHLRLGDPLFSHVLFPVYVAALLWGGLWLRDRRVRALAAFRDR